MVSGSPVWKRNSFLKRHPALTRDQFRQHYRDVHGPLASAQAGFRKYSLRYVQNHVQDQADGRDSAFDGITMTTQVPRADYRRGFFAEPDYANVKQDELYLLDIASTVSVLGEVVSGPASPQPGFKAIVLTGPGWTASDAGGPSTRLSVSRLDVAHASALGFGGAAFAHPFMVECWFAAEPERASALANAARLFGDGAVALPVREILIFGPEKPWPSDAPTPA